MNQSNEIALSASQKVEREVVAHVEAATKRYSGVLALDCVEFDLAPGEVRAVLGKNGAGKSTLIRILTGAETPDSGRVFIAGQAINSYTAHRTRVASDLGVRVVYQELSLVPGMSIAENLFMGRWPHNSLGLDRIAMRQQTVEALAVVGLSEDPWLAVERLTPAARQLVEIARAMMGAPKLIILDEPTSSLAAAEVELVFTAIRSMRAKGVAIIYVSHRMNEIRAIADSATVMRDGRIIATLPTGKLDTRGIIRMMLGHDEGGAVKISSSATDTIALKLKSIARRPKLAKVDFELRQGEVLGLAGLLGAGRTELLRIIAGLDQPDEGQVEVWGHDVSLSGYRQRLANGLGLTPENRKDDGIFPLLGIDENIILSKPSSVSTMSVLSWRRIADATMSIIKRMSVKAPLTMTPIGTLSGGNQQKIVIGRWIFSEAKILLLDEPTRGVDVEAKEQIYGIIRGLAAEGCGIIFVSSEIEELPKVCDRVIVLRDGMVTDEFTSKSMDADQLLAATIAG